MNLKLRTFLLGAAEATAVGILIGIGTVWAEPGDVQFTSAGLAAAGITAAKYGVIYLLGWLRTTAGMQK